MAAMRQLLGWLAEGKIKPLISAAIRWPTPRKP